MRCGKGVKEEDLWSISCATMVSLVDLLGMADFNSHVNKLQNLMYLNGKFRIDSFELKGENLHVPLK